MPDSDGVLAAIEQRSSTLFLVAGAILVVYAALHGLEAFLDIAYPMARDSFFRLAGYILGFIALLGLYPSLVERSPKLARAGAVFTVLGIIGWLVDGLVGTTRSLAVYLGAEPPAWTAAFGLLIIVGFVLGYITFSAASLRTGVYSRTVGFILLAPAAAMVMNLAIVAVTGPGGKQEQFVVASAFALAHLAIGFALNTEDISIYQEEPSTDTTVR